VSGASPSHNEVANNFAPGSTLNYVNPVHVLAGGAGLISAIQTGNVGAGGGHLMMQFGADDPLGAGGGTGLSIENLANLPAGTQRTILWPAMLKQGGAAPGGVYYSADFQGFVAGTLDVTDNLPLDFGPPNEHGASTNYDPSMWADHPYNSQFGAGGTYANWWDPTARGIPLANYILFENMSSDTLEILARNIHGMDMAGVGSTGGIETGGITGIQIVARAAAVSIPEPASIALWSVIGLLGACLSGRRLRNR
jgi:hypothetical protein